MFKFVLESSVSDWFSCASKSKIYPNLGKWKDGERVGTRKGDGHFSIKIFKHSKTSRFGVF